MVLAFSTLIVGVSLLTAADDAKQEVLRLEEEFWAARLRNDTAKLGHILADEWEIILPTGEVWTKETVLMLLKTGTLAVKSGEKSDVKVRVYGDTAVVTVRTIAKGKYKGVDYSVDERWTDVFVKKNGRWQCVASQSTHIAK
jgi:ketosteroid isomerase-like protein